MDRIGNRNNSNGRICGGNLHEISERNRNEPNRFLKCDRSPEHIWKVMRTGEVGRVHGIRRGTKIQGGLISERG